MVKTESAGFTDHSDDSFFLGYAIGKGRSPMSPVTLLTRNEWNSLSTAEKRELNLVAIQDYIEGYIRGELVNGSDYVPGPVLLHFDAMNGSSETPIAYTFPVDFGEKTVTFLLPCLRVAATNKNIGNLEIKHNDRDITSEFIVCDRVGTKTHIFYGCKITAKSGDTLEISNTRLITGGGVQMVLLENVELADVTVVGFADNNNSTFTIPQSLVNWYFECAKFGYYDTRNTFPSVRIFQCLDRSEQSTPCPNESIYWGGGTYVLTIRKDDE